MACMVQMMHCLITMMMSLCLRLSRTTSYAMTRDTRVHCMSIYISIAKDSMSYLERDPRHHVVMFAKVFEVLDGCNMYSAPALTAEQLHPIAAPIAACSSAALLLHQRHVSREPPSICTCSALSYAVCAYKGRAASHMLARLMRGHIACFHWEPCGPWSRKSVAPTAPRPT